MPKNNVTDLITDQEIAFAPFTLGRDQILARLWEIANLDPERTRGSASAQVKALSMIVAIEGLIPERGAVSAKNKPAPEPVTPPPFYVSAWRRQQEQEENQDPQPDPAYQGAEPPSPPVSAPAPEPALGLTQPVARPLNPAPATSNVPRVPMADYFAHHTTSPFNRRR